MKIPVEVSARHVHLCQKDLEILFGKNYNLRIKKEISQPGQFAAAETVTLKNGNNTIERVRVLGPTRKDTQVEISRTDAYLLHMDPPVRISGNIASSPGIILIGPKNSVKLSKGVIIAKRHLHISPEEAKTMKLNSKQKVSVKIPGERSVVFNEVIVRSRASVDKLGLHLDTDEANAANVKTGSLGEII